VNCVVVVMVMKKIVVVGCLENSAVYRLSIAILRGILQSGTEAQWMDTLGEVVENPFNSLTSGDPPALTSSDH
jgi:hypothetical protein